MDTESKNSSGHEEFARLLLSNWQSDPELKGGCLVILDEHQNLQFSTRKVGETPELDEEAFRHLVLVAAETQGTAWASEEGGLVYPLRRGESFLGLCLLFPKEGAPVRDNWQSQIQNFCDELAEAQPTPQEPPTLDALAATIPERSEAEEDPGKKLHWESSKTRVDIPVQEELADYLFIDHLPLF